MANYAKEWNRPEYTSSILVLAYTWVPLAVAHNWYHQMAADHKP